MNQDQDDQDEGGGVDRGHDDAVLRPRQLPYGPWIFRKMVLYPPHKIPNGSFVGIRDKQARLLAHGFINRRSEITFRVLGGPGDTDFRALLRARLTAAHDFRTQVLKLHEVTDAARIVHGEADGLSGLIVDRYGTTLVVLIYTLGWVRHADVLEAELRRLPGVERLVFLADPRSAEIEGYTIPAPPKGLSQQIREHGVTFQADLSEGHKTGVFLDQRDNRSLVSRYAHGRRMLDLCTNSGGFALHAKKRGHAKSVTGVDLDEKAIAAAQRNAKLNQLAIEWVHADLFDYLRARTAAGDNWDLVVLDPHKLAAGRGEVEAALSRYRDMNRLAFEAVKPGGLLATFSCSGAVSEDQFIGVVHEAARLAKRHAKVLHFLCAAPDHPVNLDFKEGRYLKGCLIHVTT